VGESHPDYRPVRDSFDLLGVLGWSEDDRRREFQGAALKRATLAMMKRNAIIVAGNQLRRTPNSALRDRIAGIACDDSEPVMVRETAAAVLEAIGP
jgi:epoxyqueuosine reductase QueG